MAEKSNASVVRHPGLIDEGGHPDQPVEWWYYNTIISAPGTPVDGWVAVTILTSFRNVIETVHGLLVPMDGETIDLSGYGLAPNSIKYSGKDVDVSWNKNRCRGKYPNWEVHFEGAYNNKNYGVDLDLTADMNSNAFTYKFDNTTLNHFVVFRNKTKGKITIDKNVYPVTGIGYYEHFYGFLDVMNASGWHWYWCPVGGPEKLVINLGLGVMRDNTVPISFLHCSTDGENLYQFEQYDFKAEKQGDIGGIKYPMVLRLEQKKTDCEMLVTVTRTPSCYSKLNDSPFGKAAFVTGNAGLEGYLKFMGKKYDIKGRAWGSSMLFEMR